MRVSQVSGADRLFLVGLAPAWAAGARVALVVGNSAYEFAPKLANPSNDANDMTERLKALGFEVIGGTDLDRRSLVEALIKFGRAAEKADVALFFYAGHGLQVNGENYLVPVDAQVEYQAEIDISLVSLSGVMQQLERGSKTNIIFLDACRDNPFEKQLATVGEPLGVVDRQGSRPRADRLRHLHRLRDRAGCGGARTAPAAIRRSPPRC